MGPCGPAASPLGVSDPGAGGYWRGPFFARLRVPRSCAPFASGRRLCRRSRLRIVSRGGAGNRRGCGGLHSGSGAAGRGKGGPDRHPVRLCHHLVHRYRRLFCRAHHGRAEALAAPLAQQDVVRGRRWRRDWNTRRLRPSVGHGFDLHLADAGPGARSQHCRTSGRSCRIRLQASLRCEGCGRLIPAWGVLDRLDGFMAAILVAL